MSIAFHIKIDSWKHRKGYFLLFIQIAIVFRN